MGGGRGRGWALRVRRRAPRLAARALLARRLARALARSHAVKTPFTPTSLCATLQGNAFLQTQLAKRNAGREDMEAEWRAKHKALQ